MFNTLNPPTVVVDARDSQLHQDYTINSEKIRLLSKSQLVAFGLKSYIFCILLKSKINSLEIATGATLKLPNFTVVSVHQCAKAHCAAFRHSGRQRRFQVEKIR
jgi:hypothetical protein